MATEPARPELRLSEPVNAAILAVSEDSLSGFHRDPFGQISRLSGVPVQTVIERIRALLAVGVIRRVRQTLIATDLAEGALVAWRLPDEGLETAFDFMYRQDPFSGHVVIRSADNGTPGSAYRLWTTLKVPNGYSLQGHCRFLKERVGAQEYRTMPAKAAFLLGVGHTRRRQLEPGNRSASPAEVMYPQQTDLDERQWRVLTALKREFAPEEIERDIWRRRAQEAGMDIDAFCQAAESLDRQRLLGRFSTFLEHSKPSPTGEQVSRHNALFHWAAPPGREIEAGREAGRHHVLTHCYWRDAGPEFGNVNIMAVAHGMEKELVLAHKAAIDAHLESAGIPISYSNVFWGGRAEIKPSEVSPAAYAEWCAEMGIDAEAMRAPGG
jgi:hypothetical protein